MDEEIKNEIKKTSKKAGGSLALWGIGALLICCGGPLVLLAIVSGGLTGLLGLIFTNVYIVAIGTLISILALVWLSVKFIKIKNRRG